MTRDLGIYNHRFINSVNILRMDFNLDLYESNQCYNMEKRIGYFKSDFNREDMHWIFQNFFLIVKQYILRFGIHLYS